MTSDYPEHHSAAIHGSGKAYADDLNNARYSALVRLDVEPGEHLRRGPAPESGADRVTAQRNAVMKLLPDGDALAAMFEPGSVTVQFGAPSQAVAFSTNALRVMTEAGFRVRAALHVAWVTWTGRGFDSDGLMILKQAIAVADPGKLVATEGFHLLLHETSRHWRPVDHRGQMSVANGFEVYQLAGSAGDIRQESPLVTTPGSSRRPRALKSLSRRERQVAALIGRGDTNRQVASALRIAPSTVERHVSNMFGKLDVNSRVAVAVMAASGQL